MLPPRGVLPPPPRQLPALPDATWAAELAHEFTPKVLRLADDVDNRLRWVFLGTNPNKLTMPKARRGRALAAQLAAAQGGCAYACLQSPT